MSIRVNPLYFHSLQAIFELSRGEQDLIEDLKLARKVCLFYIFGS